MSKYVLEKIYQKSEQCFVHSSQEIDLTYKSHFKIQPKRRKVVLVFQSLHLFLKSYQSNKSP